MNYEDKYKQALERAKKLYEQGTITESLHFVFPELIEIESEKIREEIIAFLRSKNGYMTPNEDWDFHNRWLAWLEKQKDYIKLSNSAYTSNRDINEFADKYSHTIWENLMDNFNKIENYSIGCNDVSDLVLNAIIHTYYWLEKQGHTFTKKDIDDTYLKDKCDAKHEIENQGEQPTDKIEPKFKVGDWIVINATTYQITEIDNSHVVLSLNGRECNFRLNVLNLNNAYLWTINDAKDGDVLVTEDYIFIFKYILHGGVYLYCHYNFDDEEFDSDIPDAVIGNIHDNGIHFRPATKEQRDLFFSKMKEDGYEWDADKKELKKIEPKIINPDVLQELNKLKEEIKELKEEIKNLNNRRRWK